MELIAHIQAPIATIPVRKGLGLSGPQLLHVADLAAIAFGHALSLPPEGEERQSIVTLEIQRLTDEGFQSSTCALHFTRSSEVALAIIRRATEILSDRYATWITSNADKHPTERAPLLLEMEMHSIIAACEKQEPHKLVQTSTLRPEL